MEVGGDQQVVQEGHLDERNVQEDRNDEVEDGNESESGDESDGASSDSHNSDDDSEEHFVFTLNEEASDEDSDNDVVPWEKGCRILSANGATAPDFEFLLNDDSAIAIGRALTGNTVLMRIKIHPSPDLTIHGVTAFLIGLSHSKVECVNFHNYHEPLPSPAVTKRLFRGVMNVVPAVCFPMSILGDGDAARIGEALEGNTKVESLMLLIGSQLTADGARCLIKGLKGSNIQDLALVSTRWPSDSAGVEITFYEGTSTIPNVYFRHPVNNVVATSIGPSLANHMTVKSCHFVVEPELTIESAQALADAIAQSRMDKFTLECEFCIYYSPDENYNPVEVLLTQGVSKAAAIRQLCMKHLQYGMATFAEILPMLHRLEITQSDLEYFSLDPGLASATQLVSLEVSSCCGYGDDVTTFYSSVALALPFLSSLEQLCIADVDIGDEGAAAIAGNLTHATTLKALNLVRCGIGTTGFRRVIESVANNRSLANLNLAENGRIGTEGLQFIGTQLANFNLRVAVLDVTGATSQQVYRNREFAERAHRETSSALITGLQSNFYLQHLQVKGLMQSQEDKDQMNFLLSLNRHGRYFLHMDHGLPSGVWSNILSCHCDSSIIYHFLREQPMLVPATRRLQPQTESQTDKGEGN